MKPSHSISEGDDDESGAADTRRRWVLAAGAAMVAIVALLLCLIPEENRDFFWQLRTGNDILRTGQPPHFDTYSWTRAGTPWYVPEWLTFALFALAFKAGAFLDTWMLKLLLTLSLAMVVWFSLARRIAPLCALMLTVAMLMAMPFFIQERPYLMTYLLLAVSLAIIESARSGPMKRLLWLLLICAVWANLHQGVLILPAVLLAYASGDGLSTVVSGAGRHGGYARQAPWMVGVATACCLAALISPYGPHLYANVLTTVNDPTAMRMVIEWSPVTRFPAIIFLGYYLLIALVFAGYLGTRVPRDLGGLLVVAGLLAESLLHVRNIPLFAVAAVFIAAPHVESAAVACSLWLWARIGGRPRLAIRVAMLLATAAVFLAVLAHQCVGMLSRDIGPGGYSPEGVAEAVIDVGWFPVKACRFMAAEQFPPNLRIYNDYGIGGYLIYALPDEPVFVDGRADIYTGQILSDTLAVRDIADPITQNAAITRYGFDCVITSSAALGASFAERPDWAVVYADSNDDYPRYFVLLRSRPQYADLIARCQRDCRALRGAR